MNFSQRAGHGIYLAGTANPNPMQLHSRALSAAAKQPFDLLNRVVKAARNIGRDLGLLQHPAVVINDAQR
jgi:hypothetical protein